jgi:CubicO group peptidase (beta-lactamase class C family)
VGHFGEKLDGLTLAVVRRGEGQIYAKGYGKFKRDRISLIASTTKTLSAGVILSLVDDGMLDLDVPVQKYLDDVSLPSGHPNKEVTMRHLLSMTSGLPWGRGAEHKCVFDKNATLKGCGRTILEAKDYEDTEGKLRTARLPGRGLAYNENQWVVAGAVAEAVANRSQPGLHKTIFWKDLVYERLIEPCGLQDTTYGNPGNLFPPYVDEPLNSETKNPLLGQGATSTVDDLSRVLLMHLEGGVCGPERKRVLSPTRAREMQKDHVPNDMLNVFADQWEAYGMGWWRYRPFGASPPRVFVGAGVFGTMAFIVPDEGWGAVLIIEYKGGESAKPGHVMLTVMFPRIREAVLGADQHLSIPAAAFNPATVDVDVTVRRDGGRVSGEGVYDAPVYLPQGAQVYGMQVWLNGETLGRLGQTIAREEKKRGIGRTCGYAALRRWPLKAGPENWFSTLAEIGGSVIPPEGALLSTEANIIVDNTANAYVVRAVPSGSYPGLFWGSGVTSCPISGVQLTYTVPTWSQTNCSPLAARNRYWRVDMRGGPNDGQCLPSCAHLAQMGGFAASEEKPTEKNDLQDAGPAYDVEYCSMPGCPSDQSRPDWAVRGPWCLPSCRKAASLQAEFEGIEVGGQRSDGPCLWGRLPNGVWYDDNLGQVYDAEYCCRIPATGGTDD